MCVFECVNVLVCNSAFGENLTGIPVRVISAVSVRLDALLTCWAASVAFLDFNARVLVRLTCVYV